jgi:general secretion pathway protein E
LAEVHSRFASRLKAAVGSNGSGDSSVDAKAFSSPLQARQAEVDEIAIATAAAGALGAPFRDDLADCAVSHEFLSAVPIAFARRHGLVGLAGENGEMLVALSDPANVPRLQVLSKILGKPVRPVFAPREAVLGAINAAYQQQTGQAQRVIEQLDQTEVLQEIRDIEQISGGDEDLLDVTSRAPVIKLVNLMLFEAIRRQASDVHVHPYPDKLVVRMRIDGVLHDVFAPPHALREEIVSRIKVMGGMNIAERRLAQDGRATVEVGDRIVDLRISTLPTSEGERAVIRLLDKSVRLYELHELGMPANVLSGFRRLIRCDHGILLVTGPTGSGKSTTLYGALQELNSREMNILTLEDPIEYRLEGISQTQVSEKKGMTFARGLRHVLRQDPDIIMVGEIRDAETASMAIQSALTGHLVFSTLHTNDASGAVARLLDLGAEPYLIASCLLGVLAQRLVRRICPECKEVYEPTQHDLEIWDLPTRNHADKLPELHHGRGCPACLETGFRGRIGLFEFLEVTEPIREEILQRAKASSIKAHAVENGMVSLRVDGVAKAAQGVTTMDEVMRLTGRDEF